MAKFGEGDSRWIVSERQDGTNVGAWHWSEKNLDEWCKHRLNELFADVEILSAAEGGMSARTTGLVSCTGEAFANIRKGKVIPAYELEVKIGYSGAIVDGEGNEVARSSGTVLFPYIAEENHDEDPEFRIVLPTDAAPSSADMRIKDAIAKKGKAVLLKTIKVFIDECHKGGPVRIVKGGAAPAPAEEGEGEKASTGPSAPVAAKPAAAAVATAPAKERSAAATGSAVTRGDKGDAIKIREKFRARPIDIYDSLTNPQRIMAFSRSPCEFTPQPGTPFMMYGGNIQGRNLVLEPGKRIEQEWRFSSWPENCFSKLVITLEEPEHGDVFMTVEQTGIPHEDRFGNLDVSTATQKGWHDMILSRIHTVFGY